MSISTQGGEQRRPSVVAAGKKPPAGGEPPVESTPSDEVDANVEETDATPAVKSPTKSTGAKSTGAKTTPAKSTGAKTTPAKSAAAKTTAAKTARAAAKTTAAKSTAAKTTAAKSGGTATKTDDDGKSTTGKSGAGKRPGDAKGGRPASGPPAKSGGKGGGPRKPVTPVKVNQGRPWGPIALFSAVGLLAVAIIGYGAYAVYQGGRSWQDKATSISGIVDYFKTKPDMVAARNHKTGPLTYVVSPPAGGDHNPTWERCMGDVYDTQIPNENAVHSLEHGAIWITYNPSLAKADVEKLASKVRGKDFMLMSPYPGLDKPISLQAWGYQLKVDNASDKRIDDFIKALRQNASLEAGAVCSAGNYTTGTGTTPRDLSDQTSSSGTGS
jgi:hypothetical protein